MLVYRFLFIVIFYILTSCMIGTSFRHSELLNTIPDNTKVIVGVTNVITGDDSKKNKLFWHHTMRVVNSLTSNDGYLGHKIRKQIFGHEGWTMTVWRNEESLNSFLKGDIHRQAMQNGLDAVKEGRFVRFSIEKSKIPISWKEVEKIMNEKGRDLYFKNSQIQSK